MPYEEEGQQLEFPNEINSTPCENPIIDFAAEKVPQAEILPFYPDTGIYLPDAAQPYQSEQPPPYA